MVLLLPEGGTVAVRGGYPPEDTLDEADLAAAKWCWQNDRAAGRGADTLPGAKWLFLPHAHRPRPGRAWSASVSEPGRPPAVARPAAPAGRALRSGGAGDRADRPRPRISISARLQAETDRLRSALLTSISHDLRTPLASILGVHHQPSDYPKTL